MFDPNAGQGQSPVEAYSQLDQGQLAQVGRQFIQGFQREHSPEAQQFARMDPNSETAADVARMHEVAARQHPGVPGEVMEHPVITAALGGFAAYEVMKHLGNR
ncbi:MAG TPA: hypothetical protein VGR57_00800 [Ktedonobacterales bacterium]|nr:hypothetical protein [Ktedonobacterales bacterium]